MVIVLKQFRSIDLDEAAWEEIDRRPFKSFEDATRAVLKEGYNQSKELNVFERINEEFCDTAILINHQNERW